MHVHSLKVMPSSSTNVPHSNIVAWYAGVDASPAEIAAKAYKDAVKHFETELLKNNKKQATWIHGYTSMNDVLDVARQAQDQFSQKTEKNARLRQYVSAFASTVSSYGAVLDSLAQADPLHAGLAWGAMKFVLMGVVSHDRMMGDLYEALTRIAEVLPRVQLDGMLYNTPIMAGAIAKLYARVLLFLREAVSWYQTNAVRRTIHSLTRPLLFRDAVEDIKECTRYIDSLASAASRAEIRGLSVMNTSLQQQLRQLTQALHQQEMAGAKQLTLMHSQIQDKLDSINLQTDRTMEKILQIATNNYTLLHAIRVDTTNIHGELLLRQRDSILKSLSPEVDPEKVLRVCSALSRRYRPLLAGRDASLISKRIQTWASASQSCMLVMRTLPRAESRSKDLALQVVQCLKVVTKIPVFWHLSHPTKKGAHQDICAVLSSLVYQALRHDDSLLTKEMQKTDISAFSETKDLSTWLSLIKRVLSQMKRLFVVVEMDDLYRSHGYDAELIQMVHNILNDIYSSVNDSGTSIKLLVVTRGNIQQLLSCTERDGARLEVNIDSPMPVATRSRAPQAIRLTVTNHKGPPHVTGFVKRSI